MVKQINKLKGTVQHKLRFKDENTSLLLLRHCVLQALGMSQGSDVFRVQILQQKLRYQYYRAISKDEAKRYAHTYSLNCCPVGFSVKPKTRFCNNPKVCPWCFVRCWLYPTYSALSVVPKAVRQTFKVIVWQRVVNFNLQELPFFRANKGPHQWCSALATVQLCVPFVSAENNDLQLKHIGLQLVPADCDFVKQLSRRAVFPGLSFASFDRGTNTNIMRAMATVLRLPWANLFALNNLQNFQLLLNGVQKTRLLRITNYKQQQTTRRY